MKSHLFSVAIILFAAAYFQGAVGTDIKRSFSELTSLERIILSSSHPEIYQNFTKTSHESQLDIFSDHPIRDLLIYDIPTLVLQFAKFEDMILPTAHRTYVCEPELRNANLTKLDTKINSTHIDIKFEIPDFQIINDKYIMYYVDLIDDERRVSRGTSFNIKNYTFELTANLEYVPNIGIQVSNVNMNFGVDQFVERIYNRTTYYPNGTVVELEGSESDSAAAFNSEWERIGTDVIADAEILLNCFLSNGRNGNEECEQILNDEVEKGNFVQLLQSIGMGISLKQEELRRTAMTKVDAKIPSFLNEITVPTIKSILLDLPTLLLQVGKIMALGYIDEYFYQTYLFSSFTVGGLKDNKIQLDIQPSTFFYSLKVPNGYVYSDDFQQVSTELESGNKAMYLGLHLNISNSGFAVSGDYEFVDGVGIQVSNLSLTLLLGQLQIRVPSYFTIVDGVESEVTEYKVDFAPQILEMWREVDENGLSFERKYEEYIQSVINSVLVSGNDVI
ncbi:unnamed protein product [Orchesella dallaii]|uniref:Lipid-binding serum glycoprotein C-terminal domain-containing protein n=1 Tax=Orchesella dallaii TaxID=48710 RepID=A0ABP1PLR7_9HEXA